MGVDAQARLALQLRLFPGGVVQVLPSIQMNNAGESGKRPRRLWSPFYSPLEEVSQIMTWSGTLRAPLIDLERPDETEWDCRGFVRHTAPARSTPPLGPFSVC